MGLTEGTVIEKGQTFSTLKLSVSRREVRVQSEDGPVSEEIKEYTCNLESKGQGCMTQVSIPASVPLKEFDYNAEVGLINPMASIVVTATFRGAGVDWHVKIDNLVLREQTKPHQKYKKETPKSEK